MRYSPFLAVLAFPLLLVTGSTAWAEPIIYTFDDYPVFQGGNHIAGTITTDGSLGFIEVEQHVRNWEFSILDSHGVILATAHYSDPYIGDNGIVVHASSGELSIDGGDFLTLGGGLSEHDQTVYSVGRNLDDAVAHSVTIWHDTSNRGGNFPVASGGQPISPEPATLTLVLVGIGGFVGAHLIRRSRAAAPRPIEYPTAQS
jgi:hypothetical protein